MLTEWITDHGDGVRLRNHFLFDATPGGVPVTDVETAGEGTAPAILSVVTGALEGVGATEVAIEVTAQLRRRGETAVLVDGDLVAPALVQRLQTPLTANYSRPSTPSATRSPTPPPP